ncbi:hypothetical protein BGX31_003878, partial [Mortierella sp. GBA43]
KAPVFEELDLDAWIHWPIPDPEPESSEDDDYFTERSPAGGSKKKIKKGGDQGDSKEGSDARSKKAERRERQKHDLYYIGGNGSSPKSQKKDQDDLDVDEIPIVQLGMDGFQQSIVFSKEAKSGSGKKRRGRS